LQIDLNPAHVMGMTIITVTNPAAARAEPGTHAGCPPR